MIKRASLMLALAGSAATAPIAALGRTEAIPPDVETFFGRDVAALVSRADRVEIVRLRRDADAHAYVVERTRRLSAPLAKGLRAAVLAPDTYTFPPPGTASIKLCGAFEPAVALRFSRADRSPVLDMLLCFRCGELGVVATSKVSPPLRAGDQYDASLVNRVDMSRGELDLLKLVVRSLPSDADLRDLLDERGGPHSDRTIPRGAAEPRVAADRAAPGR